MKCPFNGGGGGAVLSNTSVVRGGGYQDTHTVLLCVFECLGEGGGGGSRCLLFWMKMFLQETQGFGSKRVPDVGGPGGAWGAWGGLQSDADALHTASWKGLSNYAA